MNGASLRECQLELARHLRNPDREPGPAGVEPRRLKIYQDLIYRNIERFLSSGFPVLRSLYAADDWHPLVRSFIDRHRCRSPYFLEISQEFLHYLMEEHTPRESDPPFLAELAHYEWVELALDVSEETLPGEAPAGDLPDAVLTLSPLAWSLCYRYPVHRIGRGFQPREAASPTYLAVYRDRADTVRFMELSGATARLLELFRHNSAESVSALLLRLAAELGMDRQAGLSFGTAQVEQLLVHAILIPVSSE